MQTAVGLPQPSEPASPPSHLYTLELEEEDGKKVLEILFKGERMP